MAMIGALVGAKVDNYWICTLCDKKYEHKSKYCRHLESFSHKRLASLHSLEDEGQSDLDDDEEILEQRHEDEFNDEDDHVILSESDNDDIFDLDKDSCCNDVDKYPQSDSYESDISDEDIQMIIDQIDENNTGDYYPFPSEIYALLYMLVHSPRPFGESNLKFILYVCKKLNPFLPSLDDLKKFSLPGFVPPSKHCSVNGIDFYVNLPSTFIRNCFANPVIASKIIRHPVKAKEYIKEIYYAKKWHNDFHCPMIMSPIGHVFENDFIKFSHSVSGETLGKVLKFYDKEGEDGTFMTVELLLKIEQVWIFFPGFTLLNEPDSDVYFICQQCEVNSGNIEYVNFVEEHPLKVRAAGLPVVVAPVYIYSDDTSGNRSKKWNKFDIWCISLACLPLDSSHDISNIYFMCCSNRCDALQMAGPVAADLCRLELGIQVHDSFLHTDILVIAPVIGLLCDNAMSSTLLNHLGSTSIKLCRLCTTSDGAEVGEPRTKKLAMECIENITSEKTLEGKKRLRKLYGLKEGPNPLFNLNIDLYQSTPIEALHTILLGTSKYMVREFMNKRSPKEKTEIVARIKAFSYSGFTSRVSSNIKYFKSFVGRDFKSLMQMALHIFQPYLSSNELKCWISLSKVFRLAYCVRFQMNDAQLWKDICCDFVQCAVSYMPAYAKRLKTHLILHLVDHIVDFGPTQGYNTERFESFNSLVRSANIYGNRHSPSKDIAFRFATIQHLRFLCSGGHVDGKQCGEHLRGLFSSPIVQHFLCGIPFSELLKENLIYQPGCLRKLSHGTTTCKLCDVSTHAYYDKNGTLLRDVLRICQLHNLPESASLLSPFLKYNAVVSANGILVNVGDFIKVSSTSTKITTGIILACGILDKKFEICIVRELEPQID
uniref:C2H2-type domain-containing protein n=1 Tax=Amphimedon queenslandica TaxID=400682 RepID=A0A1X7UVS3_AMPQE